MNVLDKWLAAHGEELIAIRRDLHAHPEIAFDEYRTTRVIAERLRGLGLAPAIPTGGTGVLCDIGTDGPLIALRADIDALPIDDAKDVSYRSTNPGACHACGHDAHTTILLGAAAVLAGMDLPGRIRLIFQPAEERIPGGALGLIAAGAMKDVEAIFALHCDPRVDVGRIGLRVGPITAACDTLDVALSGNGGHTGRPHLTVDIVYALGRLITDLPGLLSRRVDPRASLSLVWGTVAAGNAPNAIPPEGLARGTLRMLDHSVWDTAEPLVRQLVEEIVAPTGARAAIQYERGVPPVVNEPGAVEVQRAAVLAGFGPDALDETVQSMGGEDFAWYLEHAPGALARLGVRTPGAAASLDLHQSTFDIDEAAIAVGVRFTVHTVLAALA
ncbi:MAG TPA: amidohydrolase [Jatrophihabitantaceae bacterium]